MARHRWTKDNGSTCECCNLHREGAGGANNYGGLAYYRDEETRRHVRAGPCSRPTTTTPRREK